MIYRAQFIASALVAFTATLAGHSWGAVIHVVPSEPIISADRAEMRNQPFDVNDDGVVDFIVQNDGFAVEFEQQSENRISSLVDVLGGFAVPEGALIGAIPEPPNDWQGALVVNPDFRIGTDVHACSGGFCVGDFSVLGAFLGLEFDIGGQTHYGWARLQGDPFFVRLEVQEWAYETVPGRPIASGAIPEPGGAIFVLLAGAMLALKRRRG